MQDSAAASSLNSASVSGLLRERFRERLTSSLADVRSKRRALRPDALAWANLAFWRDPEMRPVLEPLSSELKQLQLPNGAVAIDARFPEAAWATPFALLAWLEQGNNQEHAAKAERFLLLWKGLNWVNKQPEVLGHDTNIRGWPWVTGAHSWVEPTVSVLLALTAAGQGSQPRCDEGRRMLLNRQLPGGGWNYGNTTVYGTELRPMLHSTGMALAALANHVEFKVISNSIQYLENSLPAVRSPLSLGWGIIGLSAWNRRPSESELWIDECLRSEEHTIEYDPTLLSLLNCALLPSNRNPLLRGLLP